MEGEMAFYSQEIERAQNIDWLNALAVYCGNCLYLSMAAEKNKRGVSYASSQV